MRKSSNPVVQYSEYISTLLLHSILHRERSHSLASALQVGPGSQYLYHGKVVRFLAITESSKWVDHETSEAGATQSTTDTRIISSPGDILPFGPPVAKKDRRKCVRIVAQLSTSSSPCGSVVQILYSVQARSEIRTAEPVRLEMRSNRARTTSLCIPNVEAAQLLPVCAYVTISAKEPILIASPASFPRFCFWNFLASAWYRDLAVHSSA